MKIIAGIVLTILLAIAVVTPVEAGSCRIKVNGVVVQNNNNQPCSYSDTIVVNQPNATIVNKISVRANTGNNSGGTIATGDATAVVRIVNLVNIN